MKYDTGDLSTNNAVVVSPTTASPTSSFGGIAGIVTSGAQGGAQFRNVQVTGAVTVRGSGEVHTGGLAGRIIDVTTPRASIRNSGFMGEDNRRGQITAMQVVLAGKVIKI